ncbi:MAG: hypothetical protein OXG11_02020 [Chloroflexi bacterium]|nr:hypothetical protein [Chloroflexota bacterium]
MNSVYETGRRALPWLPRHHMISRWTSRVEAWGGFVQACGFQRFTLPAFAGMYLTGETMAGEMTIGVGVMMVGAEANSGGSTL